MQPEPRGEKLPGDCALAFPVCLDVLFFWSKSKCDAVKTSPALEGSLSFFGSHAEHTTIKILSL